MVFKVSFSRQAAIDFAEILNYISGELQNRKAANRFYNEVAKKLKLLRKMPYMFPLYHNESIGDKGFRYIIIDNYLVFYLIEDGKSAVYIARILYGKQDIAALLN